MPVTRSLVLFDIDGTLLLTRGHGLAAMLDVGRELFGPAFRSDGVDFAGRLDPLIIGDLFDLNGVPRNVDNFGRMRRAYAMELKDRLVKHPPHPLEGARELATAVAEHEGAIAALLTGNYAECGVAKIVSIGLKPELFAFAVWGDESPHDPPHRDHLPGVALERALAGGYGEVRGVVIGDTPHDVQCAHAHGMRAIGVATGKYSVDELSAAGADLTVPKLTDIQGLLAWIAGDGGYHSIARN